MMKRDGILQILKDNVEKNVYKQTFLKEKSECILRYIK